MVESWCPRSDNPGKDDNMVNIEHKHSRWCWQVLWTKSWGKSWCSFFPFLPPVSLPLSSRALMSIRSVLRSFCAPYWYKARNSWPLLYFPAFDLCLLFRVSKVLFSENPGREGVKLLLCSHFKKFQTNNSVHGVLPYPLFWFKSKCEHQL